MFLQYVFVLLGNAVTIVNTNVLFMTDNSDELLDGITNLVILAKGEKRINKLEPWLEKMLLPILSILTLMFHASSNCKSIIDLMRVYIV